MRINLLTTPVLVLNASYEPMHVCSARRAFTQIMKGIAVVEKASDKVIRTGRMTLPVPSVIRLQEYRKLKHRNRVDAPRKGIMARDHHQCQYCGGTGQLTLDHIMPQSRGGEKTWDNLVAACKPCNNRKADRTPEEAGMPLARRPKPFTVHTSRHLLRESGLQEPAWQRYLFYENDTPQVTVQ